MDDRHLDGEAPDLDAALAAAAGDAGEASGLDRTDHELLGLMAYDVDPVAPSPALKLRVMAAIREPAAAGPPEGASLAPLRRAGAPPDRPGRAVKWFAALAAGVALAAVLLSGWQAVRLADREATIADLDRRLTAAERRAADLGLASGEAVLRNRELAAQLAAVTAPGIEVCPLRPTAEGRGAPLPSVTRALLFIATADGVWYLRVHDLPPPPDGAVYVLWFLGDGGATLSGGVVPAVAGEGAETGVLVHGPLPAARGMSRGVALTVERSPWATRPAGPMVLFGDEKMGPL